MRSGLLSIVFSCFIVLCFSPAWCKTGDKTNTRAWHLLLDNQPQKALTIFKENCGADDPIIAGEAYRGMSEVALYLGNNREACRSFFISYLKDGNDLNVSCPLMKVAEFSREAWGHEIKEGYKVIGQLSKTPGLFTGQSQEDLASRYLNDGKVKKAASIIRDMGCILDWQYIGPFDNISHSGYHKVFPPETEIDFSKSYPGKDGNRAKWYSLVSAPTSPWIFVEDHLPVSNAINYFYCAISSPVDQEAQLAFGASGMFKVFLNGTVVIADSIFRNTGSDMFIQRVKLFKGNNPLLIKLGHEWGIRSGDDVKLSNFSIRFLDMGYAPLKGLQVSLQPAKAHEGAPAPTEVRSQPIVDSVVTVLSGRMQKNPDDVDAAILLMHFYNGTESTDENQKLIRSWLGRYPKSALLLMLLRESLWRAKKYTEGQTVAKAAYRAAPDQIDAWTAELGTIIASGDAQRIVRYIEQAPAHCRSSFNAEYQLLSAHIELNNRNAVLEGLGRLEKNHLSNSTAISILASSYVEQGNVAKAKKLIEMYLKYDRTCTQLYQTLSQIALKSGNLTQALRATTKGLVYKPIDANAWFYLSKLALYSKKYAEALAHLENAQAIMPASAGILNLKGSILEAINDSKKAEQAYADAITYTSDDFNAWDNLRRMKDKPGLDSLAPLPSIESLLKKSATWDRRDYENGAILSYIDDIFYYPSKCSKERQFLAVYLGTKQAIDNWKEYQVGYNSNFQTCVIDRALTIKADGNQVPADQNDNEVVFKSLQTGDAILIEWTIKNYYSGEMAQQVWGETAFQLNSPVFDQRVRIVTPQSDTIPFQVFGDSLMQHSAVVGDYRVVTISRAPYGDLVAETFRAGDWPGNRKVIYSTFPSWSAIVQWYGNLTAHIQDNSLEVQALVDSLTNGISSPREKVKNIHAYITSNIRYSFVSFRQSGWIPQSANDVVATRIGDCKDMAALGKTLFEKAGVPANLVLVNTNLHHYLDHAAIGPDFNHCILSYELDDAIHYTDFTDNSAPLGTLPLSDQSAMALIIAPGQTAPLLLPLDSASNRRIERTVVSKLDENGNLDESISSVRTGVLASSFRYDYRQLSPKKSKLQLQQILTKKFPDIVLDSFTIKDIDSLQDSIVYAYNYQARNTATFSGSTAIFPLHLPDAIESNDYPTAEKRFTPIDLSMTSSGISQQQMHLDLSLPQGWKPLSLPEKVSLSSPYGTYDISFALKGKVITCRRNARFSVYRPIDVGEYAAFREFYNAVAKADAVQLVFTTK